MSATSAPALLFVAAAALCVVLAVLYWFRVLTFSVTNVADAHYTKHTILFAILAVACLIAANFARPKPA
ncbi:MAG: hypothetical protein M3024_04370 [Candidatus Dormibacteraeota bacterium]|nr:hypothetical protein [Candidatus Dormibacteraeota bacterium]